MKNFVKLIQQVHKEHYSKLKAKLVKEKTPVALLELYSKVDNSVDLVKKLLVQKWNIKTLITDSNQLPEGDLDFEVINFKNVAKITPPPEYILVTDFLRARMVQKLFPSSKALLIGHIDRSYYYYETFMAHLPELQEVYESLIDEESKKTFRGYWLARTTCQPNRIIYANTAHYLISGFIPERNAVVIDAGVFDGGTARVLSEMGYKVYGFELDKKNYENTRQLAEEKNFTLENLGLGSYKHIAKYTPSGKSGSKLTDVGAETVEVTTIDAYVREHDLPRVDFIKMDVEGAELDILKGAKTTIARFKPILALSAYHKVDDFWTLMNFVKSIRPDYEFAMRQSYETPEEEPTNFNEVIIRRITSLGLELDLRNWCECVLFAR